MIKSIFKYRKLIWDFVVRDYKSRFAGSSLGFLWNIINPLILIVIYAVIFTNVMGAKLQILGIVNKFNYSIFLCSGIVPWLAFAEVLSRSSGIYLENANLIKKMAFPEEILNVYVVVSASINFLITFTIYLIFLMIVKYPISWYMLLVIPIFILQMLFVGTLGLAVSSLAVFFRDILQMVNVLIQLWFWGTPIIYQMDAIPLSVRKIIMLNPMYYFIEAYHKVIMEGKLPDKFHIIMMLIIVFISTIIGSLTFKKLKSEIPDEI